VCPDFAFCFATQSYKAKGNEKKMKNKKNQQQFEKNVVREKKITFFRAAVVAAATAKRDRITENNTHMKNFFRSKCIYMCLTKEGK
jgi:hypothetical protein